MKRRFRQSCLKPRLRQTPNASFAIQPPFFFGKCFLAVANRARAYSKSSLPSQNSMTSFARETKCSIWELKRRPRRRHISSSSALCSSDMRMLYRRFFFATHKPCQSKRINTWRKRVDKGRHRLRLGSPFVSQTSPEGSGRNEETCGKISPGKMNSSERVADAREESTFCRQNTRTIDNVSLESLLSRLMAGASSVPVGCKILSKDDVLMAAIRT